MIKKLRNLIFGKPDSDAVKFQGLNLPTFRSNQGLANNETYLESGREQIETLQEHGLLNEQTSLLDFGCGQGRLVNSLEYYGTSIASYYGIDTQKKSINWCKTWLSPYGEKYQFIHLPAFNARYNQSTKGLQPLPFSENTFDLVFLNSVFSHMLPEDITFYLNEFHRVLKADGSIYATAFVEENVPEVEENPKDYFGGHQGPLLRVRYEKSFFLELFKNADFTVQHFHHQHIKRTGQSVIIAQRS